MKKSFFPLNRIFSYSSKERELQTSCWEYFAVMQSSFREWEKLDGYKKLNLSDKNLQMMHNYTEIKFFLV